MFKIKSNFYSNTVYIGNGLNKYLHCDGRVVSVCEYFESKEAAQKVLDKYYPKPKHEWVHGDVFENSLGIWIYLQPKSGPVSINLEHTNSNGTPEFQLKLAKFLFNINDAIKEKL